MKYLKRSVEKVVLDSAKTFKCVLITGARQTGKSTLLKNLFPQKKFVSFDDPFVEEEAKKNPETFLAFNAPPVIFDEVQLAPGLFRYIKMACDGSVGRGLYFLSGSQPFSLMKNVSESLAGRVSIIELGGLSLREIQKSPFSLPFLPTIEYVQQRNASAKAPKNIWEIIHRGGYPELYSGDVDWNAFFASYVKTYLERDVRQLTAVQDLNAFQRFMVAIAARTGQILNYANIADEIGKDQSTIKSWVSILEASGIIYLLEPYMSSALKRVIKSPKIYFRDTGLACYLTRWLTPETAANGAMSGALFETYVVSEIIKSYSNRGMDYRYFISYYRGKDNRESEQEIDLIIESDGVLYPIEIKKSQDVSLDATAAFKILDKIEEKKRGMGAIICNCPMPSLARENVLKIPVFYI